REQRPSGGPGDDLDELPSADGAGVDLDRRVQGLPGRGIVPVMNVEAAPGGEVGDEAPLDGARLVGERRPYRVHGVLDRVRRVNRAERRGEVQELDRSEGCTARFGHGVRPESAPRRIDINTGPDASAPTQALESC